MNSCVHGLRVSTMFCTQLAENASALRTPCHAGTGCGARQRRFPTGGAANGTALNTTTPDAIAVPPSWPPATRTVVSAAGCRMDAPVITPPSIATARSVFTDANIPVQKDERGLHCEMDDGIVVVRGLERWIGNGGVFPANERAEEPDDDERVFRN